MAAVSVVAGRAFARSTTSSSRISISTTWQCSRLRAPRVQVFSKAVSVSTRTRIRSYTASAKPCQKRYTNDHEWVELSADGTTGTIGISTYAAKALGDVVYVELPQPDLQVSAGDPIGAVESVKSASDIMTPISGTIIEANSVLEDTPATINQSPEGDGWLAKIKVSDKTELDKLKTADEYQKFTDEAGDH